MAPRNSFAAWAGGLLVAVVCIAVRLRASARAELLMRRTALGDVAPSQLDATNPSWWTQQVSNTAASVFWPHHRLLPRKASGLVLLNPGELSGELKDPDDPWGYSHPRCRGLPTCSSSTSSPAVTRHQQEMQRFHAVVKGGHAAQAVSKKQGLMMLNPGELSGYLKDPDDPWGYSHPRCRGLPTCSDSTSSPAVKARQAGRKQVRGIKVKQPRSLDAILSQEHRALRNLGGSKKQGLMMLNPGELSGYLKDPDDPWGYSHPRCRGLPTCSDSTSSPAVKRHQAGIKAVHQQGRPVGRSPDGHWSNPFGRSEPPGVGHPVGAARTSHKAGH